MDATSQYLQCCTTSPLASPPIIIYNIWCCGAASQLQWRSVLLHDATHSSTRWRQSELAALWAARRVCCELISVHKLAGCKRAIFQFYRKWVAFPAVCRWRIAPVGKSRVEHSLATISNFGYTSALMSLCNLLAFQRLRPWWCALYFCPLKSTWERMVFNFESICL